MGSGPRRGVMLNGTSRTGIGYRPWGGGSLLPRSGACLAISLPNRTRCCSLRVGLSSLDVLTLKDLLGVW
jgi:hypothetical protein